jgi:hypothetical protein
MQAVIKGTAVFALFLLRSSARLIDDAAGGSLECDRHQARNGKRVECCGGAPVRSDKVGSEKGPEASLHVGEEEVADLEGLKADTAGVKPALRRIGHSQTDGPGEFPAYLR